MSESRNAGAKASPKAQYMNWETSYDRIYMYKRNRSETPGNVT